MMNNKANEFTFQNDMVRQLVANGWLLGNPENYNRELARDFYIDRCAQRHLAVFEKVIAEYQQP